MKLSNSVENCVCGKINRKDRSCNDALKSDKVDLQ